MSYNRYNGIIKATIGRGENATVAAVDVSDILAPDLDATEALSTMTAQYGPRRIMDFLVGNGWRVPIERVGQAILKDGDEPDIQAATTKMTEFAHSDMAPRASVKKVSLNRDDVEAKLRADGHDPDDPSVQALINSMLR